MANHYGADISALLNSLTTTPRGKNEMLAENVVATLAAKILEAQFPEELAFAKQGTKYKLEAPKSYGANAEYDMMTRDIRVDPYYSKNSQTMYMKKDALGGYTGNFYGNPTTADVLKMVNTLRHELVHSRMPNRTVPGAKNLGTVAAEMYPDNRSKAELETEAAIQSVRNSELPSVQRSPWPLEELLATGLPVQNAEQRLGPQPPQIKEYADTVNMLLKKSPALRQWFNIWQRPELLQAGEKK